MIPARELTAYVLLAAVLAFILSCGTSTGSRRVWFNEWNGNEGYRATTSIPKIPDFSRHVPVRTLDAEEFPLDSPNRRVILVGDIHGTYKPFSQLIRNINYHSDTDVLVHTGDFLAKGLHHQSMAMLDFMTLHNVTGVRGNHDQQVIEWRGWINWICSTTEGSDWLKRTERDWRHMHDKKAFDLDKFLDSQQDSVSQNDRQWWKLIPAGWKFLSDHYRIARDMNNDQYQYLLGLPLVLYIPNAHTFVAHAGLLPSDPRYPFYDSARQPLAHIPNISLGGPDVPPCDGNLLCIDYLRRMQELSILTKIPQNTNPWVLMNMRSVKHGKIFRKYKGVYWTKFWNQEMGLCVGYNGNLTLSDDSDEAAHGSPKEHQLPCYPSTIIYGHSASRGFHPKRWSIGLDSGCVYGRTLTALVLGGPQVNRAEDDIIEEHDYEEESIGIDAAAHNRDGSDDRAESNRRKKHKKSGTIPYGDYYKARIVSVKCR